MKIYAVSDLHGNLDGLDPCDADLVVIAGDLAPMKGWGVWHIHRTRSMSCEAGAGEEEVACPNCPKRSHVLGKSLV